MKMGDKKELSQEARFEELRKLESDVLEKASIVLIESICSRWNNYKKLVTDWVQVDPDDVEATIVRRVPKQQEVKQRPDEYKEPLELNDVSPAKAYRECCPLKFMVPHAKKFEQNIIARKEIGAAYECLSQIFGYPIDGRDLDRSLIDAFAKLLAEGFAGKIPFRKKLIEIFTIANWRGLEKLKANLSEFLLLGAIQFIQNKLSEYPEINAKGFALSLPRASIHESKQQDSFSQIKKKYESFITYLECLLRDKKASTTPQNPVMSLLSTVQSTLSSLTDATTPFVTMLEELLKLIKDPILLDPQFRENQLVVATISPQFRNSWCVKYREQTREPEVGITEQEMRGVYTTSAPEPFVVLT